MLRRLVTSQVVQWVTMLDMELISRRRWRLRSAQLSGKFRCYHAQIVNNCSVLRISDSLPFGPIRGSSPPTKELHGRRQGALLLKGAKTVIGPVFVQG